MSLPSSFGVGVIFNRFCGFESVLGSTTGGGSSIFATGLLSRNLKYQTPPPRFSTFLTGRPDVVDHSDHGDLSTAGVD